ncbi:uncharacterized protein METZ01_LOCUS508746, partial [marine metagenome]
LPQRTNLPETTPFSEFIRQAFSQRRKKLKNNLPKAYQTGVLDKWAELRPEAISPKEFVHIFRMIYLG